MPRPRSMEKLFTVILDLMGQNLLIHLRGTWRIFRNLLCFFNCRLWASEVEEELVRPSRLIAFQKLTGIFPQGRGGGRGGGQRSLRTDYSEVSKSNTLFEEYYNGLLAADGSEQEEFWAALRRDLPNSFRFTGSKGYQHSIYCLCRRLTSEQLVRHCPYSSC